MKRKGQLPLDAKDRQILYFLDLNGRASYSEIAKKARISKQLAKYRVARLEAEGFIKGYYAMIDTSCLGYTTFRVYLKLRNADKEKAKAMAFWLKSQKQVWALVLLSGKWDVALGIAVKDIYEFHAIWDSILEQNLERIWDYKISIYSPIYHYPKKYLSNSQDSTSTRILGGRSEQKHDEKDIKILSAISKNARASLLELAAAVKITPEAIKARLRQLERKGIIQGYRAMIDVHKIGYEFYKAEIRLAKYIEVKRMQEYLKKHPNVYQIDRTIGGETLEVEFHVKTLKDMLSILQEFEQEFAGMVERFDYITVISEEKTTYMPEI